MKNFEIGKIYNAKYGLRHIKVIGRKDNKIAYKILDLNMKQLYTSKKYFVQDLDLYKSNGEYEFIRFIFYNNVEYFNADNEAI